MSFNGSFFNQTAYRGPAGPDTDAVWSSLGTDCKPNHSTKSLPIKPKQMRQSLFQKVKLQGTDYNKVKSSLQQIKEADL